MVVTLGIPSSVGVAACSDPFALQLVDAAFTRPGGPAAQSLKDEFCSRCEIAAACLGQAMRNGEFGVWGATSPNLKDFVLQQAFCVMDGGVQHYFLVDPDIADGTRTVADLLVLADQALRDGTSFAPTDPITRQEIAEALHNVSDAFDNCRALCSPSGAFIDEGDGAF